MVALESCKLFQGLSREELLSLESFCQSRAFRLGEVIFKEGDPGDGMYVVVSGKVQVATLLKPELKQILSRFGAGDYFGEMAVLDNEPRSASAMAEEDSQLIFIPRDSLLKILMLCPRLALNLVIQFSRRIREFNRQHVQQMLQAERLTLVGRFARSIVHDFKNPLAIISLAADLGAGDTASSDMRKVARDRIRKQVDRLSNMINELLEFSRGSQGAVVLASTPYDAFIAQLLEDIGPEVAQHHTLLVCENPPPTVRLLLDPRRMTNVFYNLLHNAMDVMPNGGKIILRFQLNNKYVVTEIEDTGPGIDPHVLSRLFEPFATYGKAHGTGLGLSICQRIIIDHHGQIQAHSEPGRGAIFSFTLPLPA